MHWLIKKIPFLTPRIHSVLVSRLGHRVEELQQYRRQVRNLLDFRMDHAGQWWNADRSSDSSEASRISEGFRAHPHVFSHVFHSNWGKKSASPFFMFWTRSSGISVWHLRVLKATRRTGDVTADCCAVKLWFHLMAQFVSKSMTHFLCFFFSSFDLMKSFDLIDMICARSSLIDCLRRFVANWGEPAKLAFSSEDCHIIHGIIMDYLDKNRWKSINNNNDPYGISFLSPIFWDFWASPSTESTSPSLLQVSAVSVAA